MATETKFQHSTPVVESSKVISGALKVTFKFWVASWGSDNDIHTRHVDALVCMEGSTQKTYINVSDHEGTDMEEIVGNVERMQMGRIVAAALTQHADAQ